MKKEADISLKQIANDHWLGLKGYRTAFFLTMIFFALTSIIEVIVPYYYKGFFNILNTATDKTRPVINSLIFILVLIAALHFVSWIFNRIGFFLSNHTEARVMANLKRNSFNYLIRHSYSFFTNSFAGGLVQKVNRQARAFEKLFDTFIFNFTPLLITIIGAVIITYFTSKILSVIILSWVVIYSILSILFYRWRIKYNIEMAEEDSKTTALLADNISNNQAISLFNGFDAEKISYEKATKKQADITIKTWDFVVIFDSLQLLLIIATEFFLFYFAVKYWQVGKISIGGIVMIQIYIISLARQIWSVNTILRNVFESLADSREMTEIMLTPHEIKNSTQATNLKVNAGKIEFKKVTFNFDEERAVINEINCLIKPGEKIGLIGPSGAGKTTFVRLVLRLYNLTSGEILIDGQNINNVTQESLRKNISLVPQDPILFHRTLKDNIRYGRPEASDEEVFKASKLANCDDFIDVLPLKYETLVGERGIKLSGGERQRIAIARAILKNAPILILDEATSSLDSQSESLIQGALDNLMKNRTTIAIAHRLSTIRKMDRIIVMKDGKIVEEGTHEELSNKDSGLYKDLWELQAGGFIQK